MSDILYDFGSGRSDPATFPTERLKKIAVEVIDREAEALTNYPGSLGHKGLRTAMAAREATREGVQVDPEHLVLTNGSMQGVTLTAEALQDQPGDTLILEEYSYPGTLGAYRSLRYDMVGIPLDEGGMRMDVLEHELTRLNREKRLPKFIYAISTYQNPTGFVMPRERRLEMITLADRYGIPIIEDNCYADVHYEGEIQPAIYALDDRPEHIYLCSLSKILAPGFRLGYILARPPMLNTILARRHDAGPNYLASAIAAEFYKEGIAEHAETTNPPLKRKRDLTCEGLKAHAADLCAWSTPPGGLFVWVRLPDDVDRNKLYANAQAKGVNYLRGSSFHYKGVDAPYLRLAFGHLTETQIIEGIPVLVKAIRECRTSNEAVTYTSLFED
ncbi:MAG: PLP-dependent aminotransferase family protein [Proteobacteria bacterium]|nr:PLP-dependent aminotransferase family protein [Pseudomonadota bacterium]